MCEPYRFLFEVADDLFDRHRGVETAGAELPCDPCDEEGVLLSAADRFAVAASLTSRAAYGDPGAASRRRERLARLASHEDCARVIAEAITERDDLIAAIDDVQDHLGVDFYVGEYGELCVSLEQVLDLLRPRPDRPREWSGPQGCRECDRHSGDHDEDCLAAERERTATALRGIDVIEHDQCGTALAEVHQQLAALHRDIERIAADLTDRTTRLEGGDGCVQIEDHLKDVMWDSLESFPLLTETRTFAAELAAEPLVKDFCRESEQHHSDPHRGCRLLVS